MYCEHLPVHLLQCVPVMTKIAARHDLLEIDAAGLGGVDVEDGAVMSSAPLCLVEILLRGKWRPGGGCVLL